MNVNNGFSTLGIHFDYLYFKVMKKLVVFIEMGVICLVLGCNQDIDKKEQPLFVSLDRTYTGIDFSNDIQENSQQNFLTYPYYYNGGGVAIGDLDQDGWDDIYFTGNMEGDRLYVNQGEMKFKDVTSESGIISQNLWTTGVSMADINHDGWLDIYVCRSGPRNFRHNLLYINQQDGTFKEDAEKYGLNDNGYSIQSYFLDYDLDGDLDMLLINHSISFYASQEQLFSQINSPAPEEANKLYRNEGADRPFVDVSVEAGIRHFGFTLSAAVGDLNRDGYPDIYIANDFFEPDRLYINQQDGTFLDQLNTSMGHISLSSMGSDIADINEDGWMDLFVCDMKARDHYRRHANMVGMTQGVFKRLREVGYVDQFMQNSLQLNRGLHTSADKEPTLYFSEIATLIGTDATDWSWSALWADFDNDGRKDLFVSNGIRRDIQYKDILEEMGQKVSPAANIGVLDIIETFPVNPQANHIFQQIDSLEFREVAEDWGLDWKGFSTGAAYSDLDHDGDLDLVLNNLDDHAQIYQNQSSKNIDHHYLNIRLVGEGNNIYGIGARVKVILEDGVIYREMATSRGFQSSVSPVLHIGLGNVQNIQEILLDWPNGQRSRIHSPLPDQLLTVQQVDASEQITRKTEPVPGFWEEITSGFNISVKHTENSYDDFLHERLLPYKYSCLGPALASGDIDGDGIEDIFLGGAKGHPGQFFLRKPDNILQRLELNVLFEDASYEDIDATFLDADSDGDLDLYVVSGGNEWVAGSEFYQDRLYLNRGNSLFERAVGWIPNIHVSGSCVRPCDFDRDGDLDLFVGGRMVPGQYGKSPLSYLLEHVGDKWLDVTESRAPELMYAGMVTDAAWKKGKDGSSQELWIVGEWMGVMVLENDQERLTSKESQNLEGVPNHVMSLDSLTGWWQCIEIADINGDGEDEIILGNAGNNYPFGPQVGKPLELYANDFDRNGSWEAILAYHEDDDIYPIKGRQWIVDQIPAIKKNFANYSSYARADMDTLLYGLNRVNMIHRVVHTFQSIILQNNGSDTWSYIPLPQSVQFSPIQDILLYDRKGKKDLIMVGNITDMDIETPPQNAGKGIYLSFKEGRLKDIPVQLSGWFVSGNARKLQWIPETSGKDLILVANNDGKLQFFSSNDQIP